MNNVKVKPKFSEPILSLSIADNFKLKSDGTLIINCLTEILKNCPLQFYVVDVKSKNKIK